MSLFPLACRPVAVQGQGSVPPCYDVAGVQYEPVIVSAPELVDISQSVTVFGWAFGLTLSVWVMALVIGAIVSIIRKT